MLSAIFSLLLCGLMAVSFTTCGGNTGQENKEAETESSPCNSWGLWSGFSVSAADDLRILTLIVYLYYTLYKHIGRSWMVLKDAGKPDVSRK